MPARLYPHLQGSYSSEQLTTLYSVVSNGVAVSAYKLRAETWFLLFGPLAGCDDCAERHTLSSWTIMRRRSALLQVEGGDRTSVLKVLDWKTLRDLD